MLDAERRSELQNAFEVLTRHNLYRRGYCDMQAADCEPKEIGEAIDIACGIMLEYADLEKWVDKLRVKNKELTAENDELKKLLQAIEDRGDNLFDRMQNALHENQRLKALLASHRIKYKR